MESIAFMPSHARPFHSLLTLGVGARLAIAATAAAVLWVAMAWALL
ncbi:MAG TPA: hypothetical protein PK620_16645 [Denitromonas sp.]|nr:hypothetical protein [Denitromonas sp.]